MCVFFDVAKRFRREKSKALLFPTRRMRKFCTLLIIFAVSFLHGCHFALASLSNTLFVANRSISHTVPERAPTSCMYACFRISAPFGSPTDNRFRSEYRSSTDTLSAVVAII